MFGHDYSPFACDRAVGSAADVLAGMEQTALALALAVAGQWQQRPQLQPAFERRPQQELRKRIEYGEIGGMVQRYRVHIVRSPFLNRVCCVAWGCCGVWNADCGGCITYVMAIICGWCCWTCW